MFNLQITPIYISIKFHVQHVNNFILGKLQKPYVKELNNIKVMLDLAMKRVVYLIMLRNSNIKLIGISLLSYIILKIFIQEIKLKVFKLKILSKKIRIYILWLIITYVLLC